MQSPASLTAGPTAVDDAFSHPATGISPRRFVGRQGIFTESGDVHGYEFLYRAGREHTLRAGREHTLRVDRWSAAAQDRATLRVLEATFSGTGVQSVAAHALVFVNFTRSFLVSDLPVPPRPGQLVIEVVESVRADAAVVRGVATLRAQGFRIAIDDFVGLDSQLPLLPYADYVKIDRRDLVRGPALLDLARTYGATLVAERIETAAEWECCRALGFDLFQGNHLEATQVLNRTPIMSRRPVARSWTPKTVTPTAVGGTTSSARTTASTATRTAATIPSPRDPVAR